MHTSHTGKLFRFGVKIVNVCNIACIIQRGAHFRKNEFTLSKICNPFHSMTNDYTFVYVLLDCLKSFTSLEQLEESEWYYCERCGSRQKSSKQLSMCSLPNASFMIQKCHISHTNVTFRCCVYILSDFVSLLSCAQKLISMLNSL